MKQLAWGILAIVALLGGGYWWISYSEQTNAGQESASNETKEPVATVKVAPIVKGSIAEEIAIYGTVVPAAGAVQIFSVPYESRVRRIFVAEAQRISRGDNLFEIEPSPETSLQ